MAHLRYRGPLVFVAFVCWVVAALAIGVSSLDPDGYDPYSRSASREFVHPTPAVFVVLTLSFLEFAGFVCALQPWREIPSLWVTAALTALLWAWSGVSLLVLVHAPEFILLHHLWLLLISASLMAVLFARVVGRIRTTARPAVGSEAV